MATPAESKVVYAAGLAQGIVLVTFPAAFGINAEGKSLESITKPLTSSDDDESAPEGPAAVPAT